MQFGSFQQFFSSGAWKKVLEMLQQQMQGQEGQQEVQDPRLQQEGQAVQEQGMMESRYRRLNASGPWHGLRWNTRSRWPYDNMVLDHGSRKRLWIRLKRIR